MKLEKCFASKKVFKTKYNNNIIFFLINFNKNLILILNYKGIFQNENVVLLLDPY